MLSLQTWEPECCFSHAHLKMSSNSYYYAALKLSVARCCQNVGWHGIHSGSCDILTDLLSRYITTLGRTTAQYSNLGKQMAIFV